MNFKVFPFDTQYCSVKVMSPHFRNSELIYYVTNSSRAVVSFNAGALEHPIWTISGQNVKFTSKVPGTIFNLSFKSNSAILKSNHFINREKKWSGKGSYYVYTVAVPVTVVTLLTFSSTIIPVDGQEKLTTAINGLLAFFVLFLIFVSQIPTDSSNIPLLMIFFAVQICKSIDWNFNFFY